MMLKALLKVRLAAFGAYFTGASRSRRRQSKVQKIGMLAVMLYALAAFGMLFYTSFSAIAGIYAHEGFGWLYFAMYANHGVCADGVRQRLYREGAAL